MDKQVNSIPNTSTKQKAKVVIKPKSDRPILMAAHL